MEVLYVGGIDGFGGSDRLDLSGLIEPERIDADHEFADHWSIVAEGGDYRDRMRAGGLSEALEMTVYTAHADSVPVADGPVPDAVVRAYNMGESLSPYIIGEFARVLGVQAVLRGVEHINTYPNVVIDSNEYLPPKEEVSDPIGMLYTGTGLVALSAFSVEAENNVAHMSSRIATTLYHEYGHALHFSMPDQESVHKHFGWEQDGDGGLIPTESARHVAYAAGGYDLTNIREFIASIEEALCTNPKLLRWNRVPGSSPQWYAGADAIIKYARKGLSLKDFENPFGSDDLDDEHDYRHRHALVEIRQMSQEEVLDQLNPAS